MKQGPFVQSRRRIEAVRARQRRREMLNYFKFLGICYLAGLLLALIVWKFL